MKKSFDPPSTCALNPPDVQGINNQNGQRKDDANFRPNKAADSNAAFRFQRQQKRQASFPPQPMNHSWYNPTYENNNASADWSLGGAPIKKEHDPSMYKQPSRPSYPSSSDWSPGESSASNSQLSASYGMMQPQSGNSTGHRTLQHSTSVHGLTHRSQSNNSIGHGIIQQPLASNSINRGIHQSQVTNSIQHGMMTQPQTTNSMGQGLLLQQPTNSTGQQQSNSIGRPIMQQQSANSIGHRMTHHQQSTIQQPRSSNSMAHGMAQQQSAISLGHDMAQQQSANTLGHGMMQQQQSDNSLGHGMMQQQQSIDSIGQGSSTYEYNEFNYHHYNSNNNYAQESYFQQNYVQQHQQYQPQAPRVDDGFARNLPAPAVKQPILDFQRQQNQEPVERNVEQVQDVKPKKSDFLFIFHQSMVTLDNEEPEIAFSEGNDPDCQILPPPQPEATEEPLPAPQRLHTSGGHFTTSGEFQNVSNSYEFYGSRVQSCEQPNSIVQEIGIKTERNPFRYDRPSFDDIGLYASNSTVPKPLTKRKNNMNNMPPENHAIERKKGPRAPVPYQSESQWTPNSIDFGNISIKQEPIDDYNSNELDSYKDSSPSSSSSRVKTPEQSKEHPVKQPPRKRSPGRTCFDRFDKKSTPTTKKVSPLSVYAKVQDSQVINVKCRRYKKRTKPITIKEEPVSPDREEMESYKLSRLTTDQAAQYVMGNLVDKVLQYGKSDRIEDLSNMNLNHLREGLLLFCQKSNQDFRDFENASSVLVPKIKHKKNSMRASAIQKRTSPVEVSAEPPPVVKTRRRGKKKDLENAPPVEKRVLRQLPGRLCRGRLIQTSEQDINSEEARIVDQVKKVVEVPEVIDLATDCEDEEVKDAEVRKTKRGKKKSKTVKSTEKEKVSIGKSSENGKKKAAAKVVVKVKKEEKAKPVNRRRKREVSLEDVTNLLENEVLDPAEDTRRRTRSRSKKFQIPEEIPLPPPRKRRSCARPLSSSYFDPEVEIVDIRKRSCSPPMLDISQTDSPPVLNPMEVGPPALKPARKPRTKRGGRKKRRGKTKRKSVVNKESSIFDPVQMVSVEDNNMQPPVLDNSVVKIQIDGAINMEPPLLKSAEPRKSKKSNQINPPSFEPSVKLKAKDEIKVEPPSPVQTTGKENTNSDVRPLFVKPKKEDKSSILFTNNTCLLNTVEPIPTNSVAKSGSSKRKQGGPTKYLKEKSKKVTPPRFSESNSDNLNLMSDEMNGKSLCNSNLMPNFSTPKFPKLEANSFIALASDNSPESLRERYRKSFCHESPSLPNTSSRKPKESKGKLHHQKSNTQQRSFETSSRYTFDQTITEPLVKKLDSRYLIKEEPVSDDYSYNFSHITTAETKLDLKPDNKLAIKACRVAKSKKKPSKCSTSKASCDTQFPTTPKKVTKTSHSSRHSSSHLHAVLAELPEVHDSVAEAMVQECKREEMNAGSIEDDDEDSDEEKPLAFFQNKWKASKGLEQDVKPRTVSESDSEDSEGGLIIDLDRRMSVEELDATPTCPHSIEASSSANPGPSSTQVDTLPVNEECQSLEDTTKEPSSFFRDATEEAHILLQLSRSGTQSFAQDTAAPFASSEASGEEQSTVEAEVDSSEENKSILRTLLLENADETAPQDLISDPGPSTSNENNSTLEQEAERALLRLANSFSVSGINRLFDPSQFTSDQIPPELSANLLLEDSYEWTSWDLEEIKAAILKVKDEIKGLSQIADGKDRERASIVCYKKYKEEILKILVKRYSAKVKKEEKRKRKAEKKKRSNGRLPKASASTPKGTRRRANRVRTTPRTDSPSATVTSSDSLASNSGENLPTVATMVANATDNYGVDLRTVTSRQEDAPSTPTILQEALSSTEPIYRPLAIRSPLPSDERAGESSQMVQKKSLATQECSFVPRLPSEVSPRGHRSSRQRRLFASTQSTSSEFSPSSLYTPSAHSRERIPAETPRSRHLSSAASHSGAIQNRIPSPIATPTRHWRNPSDANSINLRTNLMSPIRSTTSRLTNGLSTNETSIIGPNRHSSDRSASTTRTNIHSSHMSSIRLTNGQSSKIRMTHTHPSSRSLSFGQSSEVGMTSGHPSSRSISFGLTDGQSSDSWMTSSHTSSASASFTLTNGQSSDSEMTNGQSSNRSLLTNGQSSESGMTNGQSSNHSLLTNGHSSFMIVPPPTTMPSSFSPRDPYASMSEANSEWPLDIKVEDTHENEENLRWGDHSSTCQRNHLKENSKSYK